MRNRRLEKRRRKALLQIYHAKGILEEEIKDYEMARLARPEAEVRYLGVKKALAMNPKEKMRRKLLVEYRVLGGDRGVVGGPSPFLERLAFNIASIQEEIARLEAGEYPVPLARIHLGGQEELRDRYPTWTRPLTPAEYHDRERPIRRDVTLHNFSWVNGKLDVEIKGLYGNKSLYGEGPRSIYGLSDTKTEVPGGGTGASPLFRNVWARRGMEER